MRHDNSRSLSAMQAESTAPGKPSPRVLLQGGTAGHLLILAKGPSRTAATDGSETRIERGRSMFAIGGDEPRSARTDDWGIGYG